MRPLSYLLLIALTLPLHAAESRTVKLTLSPETTYIMEPQLPDGRIDYLTALNKQLAAQTTPENNLLVGVFSVVAGEKENPLVLENKTEEDCPESTRKYRERFCKLLGLDAPPPLKSLVEITPESSVSKNYEEELLEVYSKQELALMIEKLREREKNWHKARLDDGKITQEEYEMEIKKIETETPAEYYRTIVSDQWYETLKRPWTAKEFPYIAKWLATTNVWGEKLMNFSRTHTGYYHPWLSDDENMYLLFEVLLPYAHSFRQAARYFECRGNFEFALGHDDQAMEYAFSSIRMGRIMRRGSGTIVEDLVGIAMTGIGHYQLSIYLTELSKNKDAAWILQKKKEYDAIAMEIPLPWPPAWYQAERFGILSAIQSAAVEPKRLRVFFEDEELLARYDKLFHAEAEYDWDEILKQVNFFYDDLDEMLLIPDWQRRFRAAARLEQRVAEYGKRGVGPDDAPERKAIDFLLAELSPTIGRLMDALARIEWDRQTTSVAFALAAYRADNGGASPDSLGQLVPKYLEEIPDSPFTGKPLRYLKRQHDVLIANNDTFKLDGSEEEVEKRIAEEPPGGRAYPVPRSFVFIVTR